MVTAALVAFGLLVVGWIAAPDGSARRARPEPAREQAVEQLAA